jgi:hypothetical protein
MGLSCYSLFRSLIQVSRFAVLMQFEEHGAGEADKTEVNMQSVEAQKLELDLDDRCFITGHKNGAPRIVMPVPGGKMPRTRGQVSDAAVRELMVSRITKALDSQQRDSDYSSDRYFC